MSNMKPIKIKKPMEEKKMMKTATPKKMMKTATSRGAKPKGELNRGQGVTPGTKTAAPKVPKATKIIPMAKKVATPLTNAKTTARKRKEQHVK